MRNLDPDGAVPEISFALDLSRLFQISGAALVGVALGIGIGLIVAWVVYPVQYVNADPADLRQSYKIDYVRMISAAYVLDGDIGKAKARLRQLGLNFTSKSFSDLMIQERQGSRKLPTLDALALLAQGMGFSAIPIPTPTAVVETIGVDSPTPAAQTPPSFRLATRTRLTCADAPDEPRLQFVVRDAQGHDLPNIAIEIRWTGGDDTVYTGLKPERGSGYADFDATPGNFSVTIPNTQSDIAEDLDIGEPPVNCKTDRGATTRGWKLVFQQK